MNTPVRTEWISVRNPAGETFDAYLATPPAGSGPGLVLFQEIFGVNSHIRGVAEQYALAGFVVLAPDVFWRQQPHVELGYEGDDMAKARELMTALMANPQDVVADIRGAVDALRARPEVGNTGKVGAIGYCLGGRFAYTAAALAGVDAAVAYYGGGIQQQLDLADRIGCPIQFHYGEKDSHIPAEAVDAVRRAVAGKSAEVFVYPGAEHGFNCWSRGSHQPAAAALALGRSTAFLAEQLFC